MTGELIAKAIKYFFESKHKDIPVYLDWIAPEEKMKEPYVCFGSVKTDVQPWKTGSTEKISMRMHVWTTRLDHREEIQGYMDDLTAIARGLRIEKLSLCMASASSQLVDDSTGVSLWLHGILYLDFLH